MLTNSFSQTLLKRCLCSGSSILVPWVSHFVSKWSRLVHNSSTPTIRNQARTGFMLSLHAILTSLYPHQVVLTLNELKPSIDQLSTASLTSCQRLSKKWVYPRRISIIWMRRDVRGVVEEGVFSGSIFILEISDPSIESEVQTLNLSQLLKQSVQMAHLSDLALCFQGHHFVQNGLKTILTLCVYTVTLIPLCLC